jgi:hypothetical protein
MVHVSFHAAPNQFDSRPHDPILDSTATTASHIKSGAPFTRRGVHVLNYRVFEEELEKIDSAMRQLDDRRTAIIQRMGEISSHSHPSPKVLYFPGWVRVESSLSSSDDDWPPGSKPTTDLE